MGEGGSVVVVVDSSSCCFPDDQTRPGAVLAARLYQWYSMDRWDGMGSEEFSSVRFDSLHFTDTPFSDDDDNNNNDDNDNA